MSPAIKKAAPGIACHSFAIGEDCALSGMVSSTFCDSQVTNIFKIFLHSALFCGSGLHARE